MGSDVAPKGRVKPFKCESRSARIRQLRARRRGETGARRWLNANPLKLAGASRRAGREKRRAADCECITIC